MAVSALLALAVPGAASAASYASCTGTAPVLAEYRATSPLFATDAAHTLHVTVHADGCVVTVLPAHYVRAGRHAERVDARELASIRHQLAASGLARLDAASTRQKILARTATSAAPQTRVYDEDVIEIDLHPALTQAKLQTTRQIRWTSLQTDLLAAPDEPALLGLAAAQGLFAELAERHLTTEAMP